MRRAGVVGLDEPVGAQAEPLQVRVGKFTVAAVERERQIGGVPMVLSREARGRTAAEATLSSETGEVEDDHLFTGLGSLTRDETP